MRRKSNEMSYETETKNAYRNKAKANAYKNQYIQGTKWARFTMWKQKRIITKFLDTCNLESDHTVLDIPCGTGYIGSVLAKYEASVVASDISEEMMELAKNEYSEVKFDGFIQADITKTPFPSDHFKCVIVLALMHRLPQAIILSGIAVDHQRSKQCWMKILYGQLFSLIAVENAEKLT